MVDKLTVAFAFGQIVLIASEGKLADLFNYKYIIVEHHLLAPFRVDSQLIVVKKIIG